jgi:hypothetical protein
LKFQYVPKRASWLDMIRIELSRLSGQYLDRRAPDEQTLRQEIAAWEKERNEQRAMINWRFAPADARLELRQLYPSEKVRRRSSCASV